MSIPRQATGSRAPSWADDLSALLGAMRDVHGGLLELQAREARLFELVERVTRRLLDEHAAAVVAAERDPVDAELLAERLPADPVHISPATLLDAARREGAP